MLLQNKLLLITSLTLLIFSTTEEKTWHTTFKEDLQATEVNWRGAKRVASDHSW